MRSETIGIRDAKAQLSRLISEAGRGTEWIITDRGTPVAKLTPLREAAMPLAHRLQRLEAWGWIDPAQAEAPTLPPPIDVRRDVQQTLQDDRNG